MIILIYSISKIFLGPNTRLRYIFILFYLWVGRLVWDDEFIESNFGDHPDRSLLPCIKI